MFYGSFWVQLLNLLHLQVQLSLLCMLQIVFIFMRKLWFWSFLLKEVFCRLIKFLRNSLLILLLSIGRWSQEFVDIDFIVLGLLVLRQLLELTPSIDLIVLHLSFILIDVSKEIIIDDVVVRTGQLISVILSFIIFNESEEVVKNPLVFLRLFNFLNDLLRILV